MAELAGRLGDGFNTAAGHPQLPELVALARGAHAKFARETPFEVSVFGGFPGTEAGRKRLAGFERRPADRACCSRPTPSCDTEEPVPIYPTLDQFQTLLQGPEDSPVVMVNLLTFKPRADAPDAGLSGADAYQLYGGAIARSSSPTARASCSAAGSTPR